MDEPAKLSVADRLAAELEHEGEFVDVGGFDIDAGKALAKLAQFQLADPRAHVLRLAEAGLIAGASMLRFDVEGGSLRVAFDRAEQPVVFSKTTLERLTSVLVSPTPLSADSPPRALLVQLAVAALAILRLEPRYFAIESVGADRRGCRQVYAPEPKSEVLDDAEPGTRIYVVEGLEIGRLFDKVTGTRREQELLREHCRWASTPIFLDGRRISGHPLVERAVLREPIVDFGGSVIGEAGFVAGAPGPAQVRLLARGLLIESLVLHDCSFGFLAAIDVPLPRDLSQAAVARTPELDAALALVYAVHARLAPQVKSGALQRISPNRALANRFKGRVVPTAYFVVTAAVTAGVVFGLGTSYMFVVPIFVYVAIVYAMLSRSDRR